METREVLTKMIVLAISQVNSLSASKQQQINQLHREIALFTGNARSVAQRHELVAAHELLCLRDLADGLRAISEFSKHDCPQQAYDAIQNYVNREHPETATVHKFTPHVV